jgi:FSR family fosmidomycin resistance protein-like MFS transporter
VPWRTVIPLTVVIITSSTIGIATINFAPKLFADRGYSPVYVGLSAGLYMMGSAVGGITGGTLADRFNRRLPILLGMAGSILPLYFYIPAGDPWRFGLLILTGFFAGMPHSVLVIMVQSLLPGRRAFASGLTLGLMFFSGAVGSYLLGVVADEVGLAIALQALIVLPLIAIVFTLLLPRAAVHDA